MGSPLAPVLRASVAAEQHYLLLRSFRGQLQETQAFYELSDVQTIGLLEPIPTPG